MKEIWQLCETGVYGDLMAFSDYEVAKATAEQVRLDIWPDLKLIWVGEYQLMDRFGGRVYLRIEHICVDDPTTLLHILKDIHRKGWIHHD